MVIGMIKKISLWENNPGVILLTIMTYQLLFCLDFELNYKHGYRVLTSRCLELVKCMITELECIDSCLCLYCSSGCRAYYTRSISQLQHFLLCSLRLSSSTLPLPHYLLHKKNLSYTLNFSFYNLFESRESESTLAYLKLIVQFHRHIFYHTKVSRLFY